jgi:hypothetical protein
LFLPKDVFANPKVPTSALRLLKAKALKPMEVVNMDIDARPGGREERFVAGATQKIKKNRKKYLLEELKPRPLLSRTDF